MQNEVFKSCNKNKNKNVSKEAKSFSKLVGQWGIPLGNPIFQTWKTCNKISSTMQMEWEIHKDLRNKIFKLEILNLPNSKQTTHIACNKTITILFSCKKLCLRFQIQNEPRMEQDHLNHNAWAILSPKIFLLSSKLESTMDPLGQEWSKRARMREWESKRAWVKWSKRISESNPNEEEFPP